ncbi:hypothetical protein QUF80_15505 [Desulfococcaceae bacterium HSG8]|nr:hypothetical protein [Desulfococcaceae bacterium HSG8]
MTKNQDVVFFSFFFEIFSFFLKCSGIVNTALNINHNKEERQMRIIKLSKEEFPSLNKVKEFFYEYLPSTTPVGKFMLTKRRIAKKGLEQGEKILFSYDSTIRYIAQTASTVLRNEDEKYREKYPSFFLVDLDTLHQAEFSLYEFEKKLHEKTSETKSIVRSQGWPTIPDSQFTEEFWDSLLK